MFWPGPQASPACSASTRCWPAKITCPLPCPGPRRASLYRPRLAQRVVVRLRADPSAGSLVIHGHARALSFSAARVLGETLCETCLRTPTPTPTAADCQRPLRTRAQYTRLLGSHRHAAAVDVGLLSPPRLAVDTGPPSLQLPHGTLLSPSRHGRAAPSTPPARRHCHGYGSRRRIAQHSPALGHRPYPRRGPTRGEGPLRP
jgi:hypothetical protein